MEDYELLAIYLIRPVPHWWSMFPRPVIEWGLPLSGAFALVSPVVTPTLTFTGLSQGLQRQVVTGAVIAVLGSPALSLMEMWAWVPVAAALAICSGASRIEMVKSPARARRWAWASAAVGIVLGASYVVQFVMDNLVDVQASGAP